MPRKKSEKKFSKKEQNAIVEKQAKHLHADLKRGLLPYTILVFLKDRPHYSLEIQRKLSQIAKGEFNIQRNIVYQNLRKHEENGIVGSYQEDSPVGATRKYYYLTALGNRVFKEVVIDILYPLVHVFSTILENSSKEDEFQNDGYQKELVRIQKFFTERSCN